MIPFIVMTNQCNSGCFYCFYNDEEELSFGKEAINKKSLKRFLVKAREDLSDEIILTGGEPFLVPWSYDFIKWLPENNMKASIITNLININKEKMIDAKKGIKKIITSIDHHNPKVNNILRKGSGRTRENLEFMVEQGFDIQINVVITKINYKDVRSIYTNLKPYANKIFFQPVGLDNPELQKKYGIEDLPREELEKMLIKLAPWAKQENYNLHYMRMNSYLLEGEKPFAPCQMGKEIFVIDYDGSIAPCFRRHDLKAGNIHKDEPEIIMKNLRDNYEKLDSPSCFTSKCFPLY